MAEKTKVAIIILNFNGKNDTLDCLKSLGNLKRVISEIAVYVVDNASQDDSVKAIKARYPDAILIENKKNLGFCQGNNQAAQRAFKDGADFILVLNNDTIVNPNLIEELVSLSLKLKANIISPKIYFAPGFEFHKQRYKENQKGKVLWYAGGKIDFDNVIPSHRGVDEVDQGQFDNIEETEFVTGCAMLVSKKVFNKIGLFDPVYFAYLEDADFSMRAKKYGFRLFYAPVAFLYHKNAASFGGSGSKFQDYFITRNRFIFGLRYAPKRAKIALVRESIKLLLTGSDIRKKAIKDAILKKIPELSQIR